ncbi:MAG TPA: hypothetical protein VJ831_06540, partial [Jatrophihabitantaceae bacterium]|nr:hypothetical protein [Jatrophihabitantaceae bacterium]
MFVAMVLLGLPFALLVLLVRAKSDWLQTFDHRAATDLHSFGTDHPGFVGTMRVVSDVGSPGVWWLV